MVSSVKPYHGDSIEVERRNGKTAHRKTFGFGMMWYYLCLLLL
jgi:hypothetical protein